MWQHPQEVEEEWGAGHVAPRERVPSWARAAVPSAGHAQGGPWLQGFPPPKGDLAPKAFWGAFFSNSILARIRGLHGCR